MYKGKIADKKIKDAIYYFIFRYKYIGLNIDQIERLVSPDWFKGLVSHWNFHMQKTFFMFVSIMSTDQEFFNQPL